MFKIILLTLMLFISSPIFSKAHNYKLCICAIFHNEDRFLDEWIQFHLEQGVDTIYLYNNKSDDEFMKVLYKYIRVGKVILKDWPYSNENPDWCKTQCGAYLDCIRRVKGHCDWLACIDTDEFLFSPTGKPLPRVLLDYYDCHQIGVCWILYGTSGIQRLQYGEKLTDHMVMRHKDVSKTVKSIVRPELVVDCLNPHWFVMSPGCNTVNESKEPMEGPFTTPKADILRIHHYWPRDLDFLYGEKLRRQISWNGWSEFDESWMNEVYDPRLKK